MKLDLSLVIPQALKHHTSRLQPKPSP